MEERAIRAIDDYKIFSTFGMEAIEDFIEAYQLGFADYKETVFTCFSNLDLTSVKVLAAEKDDAIAPQASYVSSFSINISFQLLAHFCRDNLLLLKMKQSSFVAFGIFIIVKAS